MTAPRRERPAVASGRTIEQELHELRTVVELIRTLTSTLKLPEILRIVLDRMKSLTHAAALSLMLYDPERDELVFAATETLRESSSPRHRISGLMLHWRGAVGFDVDPAGVSRVHRDRTWPVVSLGSVRAARS